MQENSGPENRTGECLFHCDGVFCFFRKPCLQGTKVCPQSFEVEDQRKKEGQGSNQDIAGTNQPEPWPILYLSGKLANGDDGEEFRCKRSQELTNGIVFTGSPYVRGVFIVNTKEIISVTQGDISQLRHQKLIEHDEEH